MYIYLLSFRAKYRLSTVLPLNASTETKDGKEDEKKLWQVLNIAIWSISTTRAGGHLRLCSPAVNGFNN